MHTSRLVVFALILHLWVMASRGTAQPCPTERQTILRDLQGDSLSSAGPISSPSLRPAWHTMISELPRSWSRGFTITFRPCQIPNLLGMTALTAALMFTDDESWKFADRMYHSSPFMRDMSDGVASIGDAAPQLGTAAGFAIVGLVTDDDRAVRTASQTVQAILSTGIVVQAIKHLTGRERPSHATRSAGHWDLLPNQKEYHKHVPKFDAFPSGHISTTTATLTVIMENYPELTWLRPLSYAIIGLVGLGITNRGMHWYSDLPLGIALGHLFGMIAAHPEGLGDGSDTGDQAGSLSVLPSLTPQRAGLEIIVNF